MRSKDAPHLASVIQRNIETLLEIRRQMESRKHKQDRLADTITACSGSMLFLYFHIVWFVFWILSNLGLLGITIFDPFPFGFLTMIVSLEAIFLSTFVLISQNRMAEMSDQRADLNLQIDLLAEYEITKILRLTDVMADHLHVDVTKDPELQELEEEITPDTVLQEMERLKGHLFRE